MRTTRMNALRKHMLRTCHTFVHNPPKMMPVTARRSVLCAAAAAAAAEQAPAPALLLLLRRHARRHPGRLCGARGRTRASGEPGRTAGSARRSSRVVLSRRSARRRHRVARRAAGAASARASQSGDRRPSLATGACRGAGYGPSGVRRPQPREACAVAARPAAAPSERGAPLRHASGRAARPSRAQSECSPSTRGLPRGPSLCPASLREAGTAACTQLSPQCSRRATLLRRSRPGARPQRRADRPGCRRSRRRGRSWAPTGVARKCLVTRRYAPRSERGVEGGSGSEGRGGWLKCSL
mmetsp:Transcript_6921/g.22682  ORF Transcript_6921/g.22682 Transcript_6921/m.22682 type:complete len:297 (-) Transcript_6921:634-1524(-)